MSQKIKSSVFLPLLCALIFSPRVISQSSKTVISEKWRYGTNSSPVFYKAKSKTDALRNIYVVGATLNSQNNRDLIIQKLDPSGNLIWQNVINGNANLEDIGTDVFIDAQFNVYVTGTVNRLGTQEDLTVLKFANNGTLIWEYYTDAVESESGTALTLSASKLYVTGVTTTTSALSDYKTISLDASTGSFLWSNNYNYTDLNEIPVSISVRNNALYVTGASQLTLAPQVKWEIATILYDASSGAQLSERRSSGNSTQGVDMVNDVTIDNNGDVYIVGGVVNQTSGYDIVIYKLDNNLNLIWEQFIDENGLDDVANGVKLDNIGNIYLTGYSTRQNEGKNIIIKKIDNAGGNIWSKELSGQANLDDIGIQLSLINDTSIFITGVLRNSNSADMVVTGFNENGDLITSMEYGRENGLDDIPTSICSDLDGNIVITGQTNNVGSFLTKTIKYDIYYKTMDYYMNGSEPTHVKNNVIVRFSKNAVNSNVYLNKNVVAGKASLFLNSNAISALNNKTGFNWSDLQCYRIHKKFGPNDSLSITRSGDTISTNDFWTSLCFETPKGFDEFKIIDSILTITNFIKTGGINAIYYPLTPDPYYNYQYNLFDNQMYPNADIDVNVAWGYEKGNENILVGVMDTRVDYKNPDFGDGTYSGSKVQGYDFMNNVNTAYLGNGAYFAQNHGTAVAGIIGAIRNNGIGIAGIAGGDSPNGNNGVKIFNSIIFTDTQGATDDLVQEALAFGNFLTTDGNGQGLQIQNMSFGSIYNMGETMQLLLEGYKNGCIFVAARGNNGLTNNMALFPACISQDERVINVMASGTDGNRKTTSNGGNLPSQWASSYGVDCALIQGACINCKEVDFMAPGTNELVLSTMYPLISPLNLSSCAISNDANFGCFNGTSAAAANVSGVVALMLSKHRSVNGFPNNLITEDVERILEKTAGNQNLSFNLDEGYGLINAGEAVRQVSDPYYVQHVVSTPSSTVNLGSVGNVNIFSNNYFGIPAGSYSAVKYKVTWNNSVTLPLGHNIIDFWKLDAKTQKGTNGTGTNLVTSNYIENENLQVNVGSNTSSMTGATYIYKITSNTLGTYWFPRDPANMTYSYSLHVHKQPDASIDEKSNNFFIIYPNPSNDEIEILLKNELKGKIDVEIVDEFGKVVIRKESLDPNERKISILHLKEGIYFCKLINGDHVITKSFIKTK